MWKWASEVELLGLGNGDLSVVEWQIGKLVIIACNDAIGIGWTKMSPFGIASPRKMSFLKFPGNILK